MSSILRKFYAKEVPELLLGLYSEDIVLLRDKSGKVRAEPPHALAYRIHEGFLTREISKLRFNYMDDNFKHKHHNLSHPLQMEKNENKHSEILKNLVILGALGSMIN